MTYAVWICNYTAIITFFGNCFHSRRLITHGILCTKVNTGSPVNEWYDVFPVLSGSESRLVDCEFAGWGINNCDFKKRCRSYLWYERFIFHHSGEMSVNLSCWARKFGRDEVWIPCQWIPGRRYKPWLVMSPWHPWISMIFGLRSRHYIDNEHLVIWNWGQIIIWTS